MQPIHYLYTRRVSGQKETCLVLFKILLCSVQNYPYPQAIPTNCKRGKNGGFLLSAKYDGAGSKRSASAFIKLVPDSSYVTLVQLGSRSASPKRLERLVCQGRQAHPSGPFSWLTNSTATKIWSLSTESTHIDRRETSMVNAYTICMEPIIARFA